MRGPNPPPDSSARRAPLGSVWDSLRSSETPEALFLAAGLALEQQGLALAEHATSDVDAPEGLFFLRRALVKDAAATSFSLCGPGLASADRAELESFLRELDVTLVALGLSRERDQRARESRALEAFREASRHAHPEQALHKLLAACCEATDSSTAILYLLAPSGTEMVLLAAHGAPDLLLRRYPRFDLEGTEAQRTARWMRPRAFDIRATWVLSSRDTLLEAGLHQAALVPIHLQKKLVGMMNLARTTPERYEDETLATAGRLAGHFAVHLENSNLFTEAARRVRQLSLLLRLAERANVARDVASLTQGLFEEACDAFAADAVGVYLLTRGRLVCNQHHFRVALGPAELEEAVSGFGDLPLDSATLVARAFRERRPLQAQCSPVFPPGFPFGSYAAAPLRVEDRVLGGLVLARRSSDAFLPDELALLESLGALLGVAMDRARLFELDQRRAQDLVVINRLGKQVAERADLGRVLDMGVRLLAQLCEVPQVFLFLLEPYERLQLVATNLPAEALFPVSLKLRDSSAVSNAVLTQAPVVVEDPTNDARTDAVLARHLGHRTVLAVPLLSAGQAIGAVLLAETRPDRQFGPADIERGVTLSNLLATATTSARLLEDLKRSYRELSRTQETLVQQEREAAAGQLAALVAHEVRNPLAVIFNSLASLRKLLGPEVASRAAAGADIGLLLGILTEEAERLNTMVSDFLDFARPNDPQFKRMAAGALVGSALEATTGAHPLGAVALAVEVSETLETVYGDERLLRQALINLMVNALQAMPRGGTLGVRARREDEASTSWVTFEVEDTGSGITPEARERLFQPFFTTKASGTGLGLAVVKRIAESHGGSVIAVSLPERGARFVLRIPWEPGPRTP